MRTLLPRTKVGTPRLSLPGAALHYYRQWLGADGGEARLPSGRHGPALRCGVRGTGRRETSKTCVQAVGRRARVSSEREINLYNLNGSLQGLTGVLKPNRPSSGSLSIQLIVVLYPLFYYTINTYLKVTLLKFCFTVAIYNQIFCSK